MRFGPHRVVGTDAAHRRRGDTPSTHPFSSIEPLARWGVCKKVWNSVFDSRILTRSTSARSKSAERARMPLRVACPGCQATLKLDEKLAGRKLICSNCRTEFHVSPHVIDRRPMQRKTAALAEQGGESDVEPGQLPPRQFVPESVAPPVKRSKRRRGKRWQKSRRNRSFPIGAAALQLVAGLATWFLFFRPANTQLASLTPGQTSDVNESSDVAESSSPITRAAQPRHRITNPGGSALNSKTASGKQNDRFQIVWAPGRHTESSPKLVASAAAPVMQDAVDSPEPSPDQNELKPTDNRIGSSARLTTNRPVPAAAAVAILPIAGCCFAGLFVGVAGIWGTFAKAGEPGWGALIPIYNVIILLRVAGRPLWWILLFVIPGINLLAAIVVSIDVAQNFGKHAGFGLGLAFLGFIFYPVLGFGSARYRPA
jgi:DNA-directed RNA polymerase subunit M/transcription elongation factor TFIIS